MRYNHKTSTARSMVTAALAAMLGASIWSIAANATPAFTVQVGAGNGTTCDGLNVLIRNSSTPVDANHNCSGQYGTESASAVSTYGSVGARAAATTKTNFSVDQGDGALAEFSDTLVFSRTNDALPSNVRVSANMAVHVGQLLSGNGPGGFANAVAVIGIKLGTFSQLQYTSRSDQGFLVDNPNGMTGPGTSAVCCGGIVTTPQVTLPIGSVPFSFSLLVRAGAIGLGSSSVADLLHTVQFPTGIDVFNLPDGYTVNAGTYLVNNRFIDPNAANAIPEPTSLLLTMTGMLALLFIGRPPSVSVET